MTAASRVKSGLIGVVNPRLARYSWAATVAFFTLLLQGATVGVLTIVLQQSCAVETSSKITHPAVFGATVAHSEFIADELDQNGKVVSDNGRVTTTTTVEVCLAFAADTTTHVAADAAYTYLKEDGCHPPWVKCSDGFPFDKSRPITPQNNLCFNEGAYVAGDPGKSELADITAHLGLHSNGLHRGFPKVEWCSGEDNGRRLTALQTRHASAYRYAWHTSHTCVCGGDAKWNLVINSPQDCNEWTSQRHTCDSLDPSKPSSTPAKRRLCGYEVNGPLGQADTTQVPFRATYTTKRTVVTSTCPNLLTSLGSALGWGLQLEVVFTLLLLGIFSGLGLARPLSPGGGGVISTAMGNSVEQNSAKVAVLSQQVEELKAAKP